MRVGLRHAPTLGCSRKCTPSAHKYVLSAIWRRPPHQPIRRAASGAGHLGCGDQERQIERAAELEQHLQVVLREAIRVGEEEQTQCAERLLAAEQTCRSLTCRRS